MAEPREPKPNEPETNQHEPSGFTSHSSGLASEYAREQGWGTNEEERTRQSNQKQEFDGGTDYDYGPRDFGDTAVDTSGAQPEGNLKKLVDRAKRPG